MGGHASVMPLLSSRRTHTRVGKRNASRLPPPHARETYRCTEVFPLNRMRVFGLVTLRSDVAPTAAGSPSWWSRWWRRA
jgi:hypothetical protein